MADPGFPRPAGGGGGVPKEVHQSIILPKSVRE